MNPEPSGAVTSQDVAVPVRARFDDVAKIVQCLQCERCIAQPAIAIVPVAFAARTLG